MCVRRRALVLMVLGSVTAALADLIFRVPPVTVRHSAVSRAVGTSSRLVTAPASPAPPAHQHPHQELLRFEEYFIEHDVSTADARRAAHALTDRDLSGGGAGGAACGSCSRREVDYCEWRVVSDHCCCERRYLPDPLPWLPHTCYVGPDRCHTFAHDCQHYARLRDCCCRHRLAAKWRGILSSAPAVSVTGPGAVWAGLLTVYLLGRPA